MLALSGIAWSVRLLLLFAALWLTSSKVFAWKKDELLIWTKMDFGATGFKKIEKKFALDTGKTVSVRPRELERSTIEYNQLVVLGKGPDIFLRAHDRIGEMAQAGLLAEITPSAKAMKVLDKRFWGAVQFNGRLYGYPIAVEGPTQICNAALVSEPFRTLKDVQQANHRFSDQGILALSWSYLDNYFTYGFLTAEGGYAFAKNDGRYHPGLTGVNTRGAVKGIQAVKDLYQMGYLPKEISYSVVDDAFTEGKVACVLNGPWSWARYQRAGIELLIGPYPRVERGAPKSFTGVLTAVFNPSSPNIALAQKFMEEYFLTSEGLKAMNDDVPLGAVTHIHYMQQLARENKILADAHAVWQRGEPMPNIPKMSKYWTHMDTALEEIFKKDESVSLALDEAAERISR